MAQYKISGIWKDANGVITHYAFHTVTKDGFTRATKTTKADAIKLLSHSSNEAMTWIWNYTTAFWKDGEKVAVINGSYLRSNPDNKITDNLAHLIDYDWL
ncbi:DUF3892 domain-containing protein [Mucilaginibacter sp. X4EP1]|jgi:Protein of unknown function (DUF3892)|uniref:DUF3892 domain-containing protein n=1 Tax=Mucilaginibacter sp. X4EP1 TaxID=2723092 RepID=UPI002168CA4D|nr:DUF3892 domain-containing protein [Mucilaginibacter sp. X4EP1]MCS3815095.1 hypothetical protein [Mucilaginibacter sp. X4EP1]